MKIFKQLNKKGYKHYYESTVEELDFMGKDNQHLHSEIMQVKMWLYKKHDIWIMVKHLSKTNWMYDIQNGIFSTHAEDKFNTPTEAYLAAIEYLIKNSLI